MTFVDIPFPECIAFGAHAEPTWATSVVATYSGFENTDQRWADCRHAYDVSMAVRNATDFALVRAHFHQVRGRARSFPFRDFLDDTAVQADGVLVADGGNWQLHKRYGSGGNAYLRKITRPLASGFTVWRTRSATTTEVTGSATLTNTTGGVAISGHASGDTYAWAGRFMVPCRYDTDRLPAVAVNKQPGAAGELLVQCDAIPLLEVRE